MRNPKVIHSHWRKLVDSLRDAASAQFIPEYHEPHERSSNHRYYR